MASAVDTFTVDIEAIACTIGCIVGIANKPIVVEAAFDVVAFDHIGCSHTADMGIAVIAGKQHTDFFANRVTNYSKGHMEWDSASMF